jgi:hypothetical protein
MDVRRDPTATIWRIGENLPWTASWTAEAAFRLEPSTAFPGLRELIQREAPGEGEPQFQGMNLMRQRRGIVGHLCQVCGEATPPDDRWLFPTVTGAFIKTGAGARYATHMPPYPRRLRRAGAPAMPAFASDLGRTARLPARRRAIGPGDQPACEPEPFGRTVAGWWRSVLVLPRVWAGVRPSAGAINPLEPSSSVAVFQWLVVLTAELIFLLAVVFNFGVDDDRSFRSASWRE